MSRGWHDRDREALVLLHVYAGEETPPEIFLAIEAVGLALAQRGILVETHEGQSPSRVALDDGSDPDGLYGTVEVGPDGDRSDPASRRAVEDWCTAFEAVLAMMEIQDATVRRHARVH